MQKAKKDKFDWAVIKKITEMRMERHLTQDDIAAILGVTRGFIGQIESPNNESVYKIKHLALLATEFECSPKDFLPDGPL